MRPAPPVAKMVALAWKTTISPVSMSIAVTPSTSPSASRIRSSAIHSTKNWCIRLDVALVHRVQHGVAGAVGRSAGTAHRLLAEVRHVAAERALVDLAVVEAVEGHAVVLEFDDDFVGLAAHELDRVLVAEPVGALDGVVHVPVPVVLLGVAQRWRRRRPERRRCASASGRPWSARPSCSRLRRAGSRHAGRRRRRRR
jgi:hypothetical protein